MRLHLVNPNTTPSMTAKLAAAARSAAAARTEIIATESAEGPTSIEGYFDEAICVPGVLRRIAEEERNGATGHIIACFDDTGLDAARSLASSPVVGLGEAAYHMASLIAGRFSVITTLSRSVPALEHNLVRYGLASRCARVRASDVPVLALDQPGSAARAKVTHEARRSLVEDRVEAIVLGCAGMTGLANELSRYLGVPVVEGLAAAVKLVEGLESLGLRTSKAGGWAPPLAKPAVGPNADLYVPKSSAAG